MVSPSEPQPPSARAAGAVSVQFLCPRCDEMFICGLDNLRGPGTTFQCPHCRAPFHGWSKELCMDAPVHRCVICGNEEFYIQKDFNRELGFMIVVGSALLVLLVMLVIHHLAGVICLFVVALVDWVVYRLLTNVTVCYLCQSVYRGFPLHPNHHGFYLGNEEKFKKRRQSWLKSVLGDA